MLRARSDEAKDERRQALLGAALDEFFEKGFTATRMDDIARRAKLSKGTLYLYFDSKEAMFRSLIESFALPNLAKIEQITTSAGSLRDALSGLASFVPLLIRHSEMPPYSSIAESVDEWRPLTPYILELLQERVFARFELSSTKFFCRDYQSVNCSPYQK